MRTNIDAIANLIEKPTPESGKPLAAILASAKQAWAVARFRAIQCAESADRVIQSNPYQAITTAFLVGVTIGFFLTP